MVKKDLPDYRKSYLRKNRGLTGNGNWYICSYCGRPIHRKQMQVDHIFPKSKVVGRLAVDYTPNLTSSCPHCNRKKSNKGGLWVLRGLVGKALTSILYTIQLKGLAFILLVTYLIFKFL